MVSASVSRQATLTPSSKVPDMRPMARVDLVGMEIVLRATSDLVKGGMTAILKRLGDYTRLGWNMATYSLLGLVWFAIFEVFCGKMLPRLGYLTAHRAIANDPPCISPECAFSAFWPAGMLARAHEFMSIYQPQMFLAWQRQVLFAGAQQDAFFYPPPMLLPSALISYLPYELGFFIWTFGLILFSALLLRWAGASWLVILLALLSPAALWNTELGQLGVAGGAVLLAGLMVSARKPLRAGGLLGLLVCKPQIGVLVPAVFWGQRNLRAFCAFVMMCGCLCLLVSVAFGWSVWPVYFGLGSGESTKVLNAVFNRLSYQEGGVSVFWMLRSLGAGLTVSYAAQLAVALAAMAVTGWIWRRDNLTALDRLALTVFLSLLATPYGYSDDMVGYSVVLAMLAERRGWRIGLLDVLLWLWPMLCLVEVKKTGLLITPLVVLLAVARTWYRAGLPVPHLPRKAAVLPRA